jgi:hypothetical protein
MPSSAWGTPRRRSFHGSETGGVPYAGYLGEGDPNDTADEYRNRRAPRPSQAEGRRARRLRTDPPGQGPPEQSGPFPLLDPAQDAQGQDHQPGQPGDPGNAQRATGFAVHGGRRSGRVGGRRGSQPDDARDDGRVCDAHDAMLLRGQRGRPPVVPEGTGAGRGCLPRNRRGPGQGEADPEDGHHPDPRTGRLADTLPAPCRKPWWMPGH